MAHLAVVTRELGGLSVRRAQESGVRARRVLHGLIYRRNGPRQAFWRYPDR